MSKITWPWSPKPKPTPAPEPAPAPAPAPSPKWLQAWLVLRKIPVQKLFPAVTLTSLVLFLAISGAIAWLVVLLAFAVQLFRVVT